MKEYQDNNWDRYYQKNWNTGKNSLPITKIIMNNAKKNEKGFYVGLGTGRNAIPLMDGGWDLYTSDISKVCISRMCEAFPQYQERMKRGELLDVYKKVEQFDYAVCSKLLVYDSKINTVNSLKKLKLRIKKDGDLFFEFPAIGTDIWSNWIDYSMTINGSLIVKYGENSASKLYLSFPDLCSVMEQAGFKMIKAPISVDLPRTNFPGGIVRDWVGVAKSM